MGHQESLKSNTRAFKPALGCIISHGQKKQLDTFIWQRCILCITSISAHVQRWRSPSLLRKLLDSAELASFVTNFTGYSSEAALSRRWWKCSNLHRPIWQPHVELSQCNWGAKCLILFNFHSLKQPHVAGSSHFGQKSKSEALKPQATFASSWLWGRACNWTPIASLIMQAFLVFSCQKGGRIFFWAKLQDALWQITVLILNKRPIPGLSVVVCSCKEVGSKGKRTSISCAPQTADRTSATHCVSPVSKPPRPTPEHDVKFLK